MKILLGQEYVSESDEDDSDEATCSDGEKEDARDTFVDRITVSSSALKVEVNLG